MKLFGVKIQRTKKKKIPPLATKEEFQKPEQVKAETDNTIEIPIGAKIAVEFTKIKKVHGDATEKRVVIARRNVAWRGTNKTFTQRGKNLYFIDPAELIWEERKGRRRGYWKVRYDTTWCEPLGNDGKAHRSPIVSLVLRDEVVGQLILIASTILPIQITRTMAVTTLVFAIMTAFVSLAISTQVAPQTVVHWLTSPPVIK